MRTINVNLGNRSYNILIGKGLLEKAGDLINGVVTAKRAAIISDTNVAPLYLELLSQTLQKSGLSIVPIIVDAGEKSKSFSVLQQVVDKILAARLERGDVTLALGGGVVGDLSGFAAGIVRRGMNFIQLPTSLLAQVDSSVGGKTGINSHYGKNLIGVFYQPRQVIIDTEVLDTLTPRQFRAGYAEVAKYGLINQPDFFHWLENNAKNIFSGADARAEAIARSCQFKAEVVKRDEQESGERALLNLGHTFAHALETATDYDVERLVHGEAVALGTVLAYQFSAFLHLCDARLSQRIIKHFTEVGLPIKINDIKGQVPTAEKLIELISQDKKVTNGHLTFILTRGLGQAFIAKNVPQSEVFAFLKQKLEQK